MKTRKAAKPEKDTVAKGKGLKCNRPGGPCTGGVDGACLHSWSTGERCKWLENPG